MSTKKVIVIGGGIAGLSTGCYLQMNGYESTIYEMHKKSGGLCTSWKRKGYTIDGCIHWLVGSGPSMQLHDMWTELGALDKDTEIYDPEIFIRIEGKDGEYFNLYTDIDQLEKEMLRLSPNDEEVIKEFTDAVRFFVSFQCSRNNPPPPEVQRTFGEKIPVFMQKWSKITNKGFAEKITDERLSQFFLRTFGDFVGDEASIFSLIATLGYLHAKTAGYPIGGSRPFAKRIEKRYKKLGGKIQFKSKVKEILVENNKAIGIMLDDGEKIFADIIISAADGYDTIFNMLKGKYIDEEITDYYNTLATFPPICQISFGVAREFKDSPHTIQIPLADPIKVDPKTESKVISLRIFNFDPTLAPKGKTVLSVIFEAKDYQYWRDMRENEPIKYEEMKEQLADKLITKLEKQFPDIRNKIEVIDIATPATFIRYTNNWKGSYEGWLPNMKTAGKSITETLPGLDNFYMVGHWTRPGGGLPPAAMSAKKIVGLICKQDAKEFKIK